MTLVLLVAITTATFAWYSASAGSSATKGTITNSKSVSTSKHTEISLGGLTLNVTLTWAEDNTYTAANAHLVDANGAENVWVGSTLRPVTTPDGNSYAKMNVKVSAAELVRTAGTGEISVDEKINVAGTYTLHLTKSGNGNARVHIMDAAPANNGDWIPAQDDAIELTVIVNATTGALEFSSDGIDFYYTFDGLQGETSGAETANAKDTEAIAVTFAMAWNN